MFTKTDVLTLLFAIAMGTLTLLIFAGKLQTCIQFQDPLAEVAFGAGAGALCLASLFTLLHK